MTVRKKRSETHKLFFLSLFLTLFAFSIAETEKNNRNEEIKEFMKWSKENGIVMNKIKIATVELDGVPQRGIIATSPIAEGEMIAEIPIDVMMNERTALMNNQLQRFFQSTYITATNEMAFHLLYEKFLGESSFWYPYIRLLPSSFPTSMYFREEELKELQNSTLIPNTLKRRENAKNHFHSLSSALSSLHWMNGSGRYRRYGRGRLV